MHIGPDDLKMFQPIPEDPMVAYLMHKDDAVKLRYASKIDQLRGRMQQLTEKCGELKEELRRRPLPTRFTLLKRTDAVAVAHDTGDGWSLEWEDLEGETEEIPWPFGEHLVTCEDLRKVGFTIV